LWDEGWPLATDRNGTSQFKVEDSTTAAGPVGSDWKISYADGTQSKGLLYRDTVTLFGKKVTGQELAVVDETYNDQDALVLLIEAVAAMHMSTHALSALQHHGDGPRRTRDITVEGRWSNHFFP
jgi:hypothetical protein